MTLNDYLLSRGVEDPDHYRNLSWDDVNDPRNLRHIRSAIIMIKKHIKNRTPIRILVDTDVDGYTSASMLYMSLNWLNHIGKGELVKYVLHRKNKCHGLSGDDVDLDLDNGALLIIPDAGTNDDEFITDIKRNVNIDVCVLDHHPRDISEANGDLFVLVNPQESPEYTNKQLSGAGVVYQLLRLMNDDGYHYDDLCALALIADVMDIRSQETKFLIEYGLSDIRNPFFKSLIDYTSKKTNGNLMIRNVQMYIVPLINAIIRIGSIDERDLLFKAFCCNDKELHKRVLSIAEECKKRQDTIIEGWIQTQDFSDSSQVIIKDCDIDEGVLGVVAQKVSSKTKKPTIIFNNKIHGHARGAGNFKTWCSAYGKCQGHEQAFGITVTDEERKRLEENVNTYDQSKSKEDRVDIIESAEFPLDAPNINQLCEFNSYVGTGISPLLVKFDQSVFDSDDINIIGKNKDTLKISFDDDVNLMFFFYNKDDDLYETIKKVKKNKTKLIISAICTVSKSEYFGKRSWSLIAEKYEVTEWST